MSCVLSPDGLSEKFVSDFLFSRHSSERTTDRQTEGVSLPSLELLERQTGKITQSIQHLKKAAETFDLVTFKSCTTKIQDDVEDLIDLFQPSQVIPLHSFPLNSMPQCL